jgi:hypothetical protein
MTHFAKIDENNIVTQVLVIDQETINTGHFGDPSLFVQTSYNTKGGVHYGPDGQPDGGVALRKNYAGIGYVYDPQRDAFYVTQPFPSWTLNEDTCYWEAPIPMPTDGKIYQWNEPTMSWAEIIE